MTDRVAAPVRCDGWIVVLNDDGKQYQCPNEAVYGLGVAFRNYCESCSPARVAACDRGVLTDDGTEGEAVGGR